MISLFLIPVIALSLLAGLEWFIRHRRGERRRAIEARLEEICR